MKHRGPDSGGQYAIPDGTVCVGFRRLAIRDLHQRANQPMISASGKTAIVFNGEVYNSAELAARLLPNQTLRTTGDTEVVLESFERHGEDAFREFNGMFALAAIDIASGRITLARDRMGKKPLYIFAGDGVLAFGSELRSLKPFGLRIDPEQAELFLHFGYFPSPHTFFRQTSQVCPGEVVVVQRGEIRRRSRFHQFTDEAWSQADVDIDQLTHLLGDATRLRTLSDVPLGAFLSGGIDSALVAAQLAQQRERPTPTFTVTFADQSHDEAADAANTAAELSLPHHVIRIEEQNLPELALEFDDCYEQPYADTSGLVTMLLCRAVKPHVTVALAGDGGDEFYGGYARYRWFQQALWAQRSPRLVRRLVGRGLAQLDRRRGRRLARWLAAPDAATLYAEILRNWTATDHRTLLPSVEDAEAPLEIVRSVFRRTPTDPLAQAACFDATHYIPDDLQVKIDRASMRVALEVRCPLLDYRIARFGASLRTCVKYRRGLKTVLKQMLSRQVSREILQRPKHGFSVPLDRWLRGPLRPLVHDTLGQQSVREAGWLDTETAGRVWDAFCSGRSEHAHCVWMSLSLAQHVNDLPADPLFASLQQRTNQKVA